MKKVVFMIILAAGTVSAGLKDRAAEKRCKAHLKEYAEIVDTNKMVNEIHLAYCMVNGTDISDVEEIQGCFSAIIDGLLANCMKRESGKLEI